MQWMLQKQNDLSSLIRIGAVLELINMGSRRENKINQCFFQLFSEKYHDFMTTIKMVPMMVQIS